MKNLFVIVVLVIFSSFSVLEKQQKLPNGYYRVVLDDKYKERGLNDYEFNLQDKQFIYILNTTTESFEILWVDQNSFIVKGLTEPVNPNETEQEILKKAKIYFRITKQEKNVYFFKLGEASDDYPVYAGKFIKTE